MRKEELALLRDEDLLSLARNPSSNCRADAIRLLVERSSHHANHPEVAAHAAALIHAEPLILKKIDPAAAMKAHKLPGILDVLAKDVQDTRALEQKTGALEQNLNQTADGIRGSLEEKESALRKQQEDLRASLGKELADLCQKLRETATGLSVEQRNTATVLENKQEAVKAELLQKLGELFEAHAQYGKRISDAESRVARLERSLWRKFIDWIGGALGVSDRKLF